MLARGKEISQWIKTSDDRLSDLNLDDLKKVILYYSDCIKSEEDQTLLMPQHRVSMELESSIRCVRFDHGVACGGTYALLFYNSVCNNPSLGDTRLETIDGICCLSSSITQT